MTMKLKLEGVSERVKEIGIDGIFMEKYRPFAAKVSEVGLDGIVKQVIERRRIRRDALRAVVEREMQAAKDAANAIKEHDGERTL